MSPVTRPSTCAEIAIAAVTAAGLATLATPASAVTGTLTYSCTSSADALTHDFSAVVDTNAPTTLGSTLSAAITVTSDVTVPEELADTLRGLGVATVDGTSQTTGTVDGVSRSSTLAIPRTAVTADGVPMHVLGSGPGGSITAGAVDSTILLGAGDFTASLTGYSSVGTIVLPPTTFTCVLTPPTGQNLLVDTVTSVQAATTTALTVDGPVEYGGVPTAHAEVTQAGTSSKPSGSVAFTYAGKTFTVAVKGGKAKTDLSQALTMGTNTVTAVFTPTAEDKAPNQTSATFSVVRGPTTATASVTYRDGLRRLVGKALVVSGNSTDVAGKVRFTVRRNGTKIRSAIVDLNGRDKARKIFASIRKPGSYLLVAKYLGSPTLKRSTGRIKVTVL